jgi:hypothetical protein
MFWDTVVGQLIGRDRWDNVSAINRRAASMLTSEQVCGWMCL